jgi:S1-C subfamily serine protease
MPILVPLACVLVAWADSPATPPAPPVNPLDIASALETVLADAIARAEPSVVAIAREKAETGDETTAVRGRNTAADHLTPPMAANGAGLGDDFLSFDYGSGVVIGDRGEILTAYHVVKGAARLRVRAVDRQDFWAEIIAADPRSDLAVIVPKDVSGLAPPKLRPLPLGDASTLRKGMFLVALGNPFNTARDGRASASWGILANLARRLEVSEEEKRTHGLQLRNYPTLLQLDAKLNLGMSGGAVINLKGELVGLTTAAASVAGFDAQAGYAIPMDRQGRQIVETLKKGKEYEYGFLGIGLDIRNNTSRVQSAQVNSPAALGNVRENDVILGVGDIPVADADSLVLAINSMPAGSKVKLKILRQNEVIERTVELAKFRVDGEVIATNRPIPWRGLRVDYTSIMPQTTFNPEMINALSAGGVVVTEVESNTPAAEAGLKRDLVIKYVEGQKIRNPQDFARAVAERKGPVKLVTDLGVITVK